MFPVKYPGTYKKQHKKRVKSNVYSVSSRKGIAVHFEINYILPKNFLVFFKRCLKKFFKKKKIKLFFKVKANYVISSKNKNSRMGKGVGTLDRYSFSKTSNKCFAEVFNINVFRLKLFLRFFEKRSGVRFTIYKL